MKIILGLIIIICLSIFCNAQHWQQFGNGILDGNSFYLDSMQNKLYSYGRFINQGNDTVYSPAFWNGSDWSTIGNFDFANSGDPHRIIKYNNTIFIGGSFLKSLGAPGDMVLKLNNVSNTWDTLDISPNRSVQCFCEFNTDLYIGGRFNAFGNLLAYGIAVYTSPLWATLPPFSHLPWIEKMIVFDNKLVIAGAFNTDLTLTYKGGIVQWDGLNILPMDNGLELSENPPLITDLEIFNGELFAAGFFDATNISNGNNIVRWNGNSWRDVGGGINGDIYSLQVYDGSLYAAGHFSFAGGVNSDNIAKWEGNKWCSLGSSFNGAIFDMCVFNNELIIIGGFTEIDGQPKNHIAKWIGGNYSDSCQVVDINEVQNNKFPILIYPNISAGKFTVSFLSNKYRTSTLIISDLQGRKLGQYDLSNTSERYILNIEEFDNAIYLITLTADGVVYTTKVIKNN